MDRMKKNNNQRVQSGSNRRLPTLITVIDWSKTDFSTIFPKNRRKLFEREVFLIVSLKESNLSLLKQKYPNVKHVKRIKEDWKKRNYLKKFAEKFDSSIFEYVDYTLNFDKLVIEFNRKLKGKSKVVIVDDNIYEKFRRFFLDENIIKEGAVRDPDLIRLMRIADTLANFFRRSRELYGNSNKRFEISKKIIKE